MAKNNEKALNAFIGKVAAIDGRLELLRGFMENHMECEPEEVNWGHVGSADHVLEQINELIDFLGIAKAKKEKFIAWLGGMVKPELKTERYFAEAWKIALEKDACGASYEIESGDCILGRPMSFRLT
jgi:hypothetical protein